VAFAKMDTGGNKLYLNDFSVMKKVDSDCVTMCHVPNNLAFVMFNISPNYNIITRWVCCESHIHTF